ncbi:hypothetical protein Pla108_37110 [Botrimarina colliarenosi]|uniref:Uncharacterized protein n=1 Tax=Botrimarina colliarenosi TaxID=2528001 RepID=A0A5C6A650_9BACT|nr:hypothetical protein [Botrimarina colliarenosi]TWT94860.1 hypothetical protein Pla108_37110 [Botrimarina colliarenosi]
MSRSFTVAVLATVALGLTATAVQADNGWNGRRPISRQRPNDLFYNYYVGPQPSGAAAQMYISPRPVPAAMGHTYTTYQPFMPHEMMYKHHRSYWTHNPGAGWTRTKVRYGTGGGLLQAINFGLYDDTKVGWLHGANFFDHLDQMQAFDY